MPSQSRSSKSLGRCSACNKHDNGRLPVNANLKCNMIKRWHWVPTRARSVQWRFFLPICEKASVASSPALRLPPIRFSAHEVVSATSCIGHIILQYTIGCGRSSRSVHHAMPASSKALLDHFPPTIANCTRAGRRGTDDYH